MGVLAYLNPEPQNSTLSLMIRAIIFDFDGVIADTEPLHFRAFEKVLTGTPWEITEEQYFSRYLGLTDKAMLEKLTVDRNTHFAAGQLAELLQKKYEAYLGMIANGIEPTPGLLEFMQTIPPECPVAICSGARRKEIELILSHIGICERFVTIVSSEDVQTSKPDPAGYVLTLRQLQERMADLDELDVLAIEDSPLGIRAAQGAGMRTLAIVSDSQVDVSQADSRIPNFIGLTLERLNRSYYATK
jgi:beta-phosphoglucomutase